jgi:hypothetical protein
MFLDDIPINYTAVLVAAIIYYIIGLIWYSPWIFGNQWGRHEEHSSTYQIASYIAEFIISLIIAYVLALFIEISGAEEIVEGVTTALWIWVGFIATTHFSAVLWGRKTIKHFFIHACFMLIGLIAMGAVITSFEF